MWFKKRKEQKKLENEMPTAESKKEEKPATKKVCESKMKAKATVDNKNDKETKKLSGSIEKKESKAVYRVVYDKDARLWRIKKDGAKRTIDSKHTKEEALARVAELGKKQDGRIVVHKKDGKFQKR